MTASPEVGGHASSDATINDLPPLPPALTQPADPDAFSAVLHGMLNPSAMDGPPYTYTLLPRLPEPDPDAPHWCPCGHWTGGNYMCLNGSIYGPCGDENCGGVCDDTAGVCKADGCACEEDE